MPRTTTCSGDYYCGACLRCELLQAEGYFKRLRQELQEEGEARKRNQEAADAWMNTAKRLKRERDDLHNALSDLHGCCEKVLRNVVACKPARNHAKKVLHRTRQVIEKTEGGAE